MLISVCLVTYNHEPFIGQAIDSVLMQNINVPVEIVIGDDCSTDRTREICIDYQKRYPKIIKLRIPEKNLGATPNFIENIKACKGKYISILEGDDYWTDPDKLQKQVDFLESHLDYSMVHTGKITMCNGNIYNENSREINSGVIIEDLLNENLISTLTVMVRSDIYKLAIKRALPYAKKYNWRMFDYPVWLEIALNCKIGYINEVTGVYRILSESYSHTLNRQKEYSFGKSYIDIKDFYFREYLKSNSKVNRSFIYKFRENNFHARKSLFFSYGFMALKEMKILFTTNPFFYFYLVFKKIQRLSNNQ
jgi:glycosyltransferase involved in cell wall biosynthesis